MKIEGIDVFPTISYEKAYQLIKEAEVRANIVFNSDFFHLVSNTVTYPDIPGIQFHAISKDCLLFLMPLSIGMDRKIRVRLHPMADLARFLSFEYRREGPNGNLGKYHRASHFGEVLSYYDKQSNPLSAGSIQDAIKECILEDTSGIHKLSVNQRTRYFLSFSDFQYAIGSAIGRAMSHTSDTVSPSYERSKTLFRNACALLSLKDPYQKGIGQLFLHGFPLAGHILLNDINKNGLPYTESAFLFLPEEERPALLHGIELLMEKLPDPFTRRAARVFLPDHDTWEDLLHDTGIIQ